MKKTDKNSSPLAHVLAVLSWIAVLVLWACAAGIRIHPPENFKILGLAGFAFPFALAAVLGMGLLCLICRPRMIWITLLGLLGCISTLRDFFPINLSSPPPKGCLKVMTYNVLGFNNWERDEDGKLVIPRYLLSVKPDIIALQESGNENKEKRKEVEQELKKGGYHIEWAEQEKLSMACVSRFPIVKQETVCNHYYNGAMAFFLLTAPRDTLIVINVHLQSMGLSQEDRKNYKQIVMNPQDADEVKGKRAIVKKIVDATYERAHQADTVANYVARHDDKKIILMGDINDTPVSYTHHRFTENLTDVYRATGNGFGRSFHLDAIYVRIDHIFCSSHFKPFSARVDQTVPFSDHYPVTVYLKEQGNTTATR